MHVSWRPLAALLCWSLLLSCSSEPASAPGYEAPEELGPNASIIRSPVAESAEEPDTVTTARIEFELVEHAFGEVKEGTIIEHDFAFVNTGKTPLLITKARSTCGCTVPSYPEEPIAPGEGGIVSVAFDTKNKYGRQRKPVTIIANTYPAMTTIYMDGTVINEKK